jgi:NAD(P)-dependent dehydrogenase (short-subunit alcohol dehydrogenase family)
MGKNLNAQKTAVVIGATGNLGSAVCEALSAAGYWIDPTWTRPDHPDVTQPTAYDNLPEKIDVAIYLAGVNRVAAAESLSEADWDRVFNVNLKGLFLFAQKAFPALKAAGHSSLIAISSIMATHPYPNRLAYAASKAGLEGLIRALAVEWGEHGIATHALRLGHLSGLMKSTVTNPELLNAVRRHTPSGSLVEPTEVAKYISWLANGGCASISGSIIDFDPAYTLNRWPL